MLKEQKELTKNAERSAENSSKIDVNIRKAPKIQRAKNKEEDDLETGDNIEDGFVMLGNPNMPGQSGQNELENDQETDTTWDGKLRIRLCLHGRGYMISKRLHENDLSVCFVLLRHGRERHILLAGIWTR